MATLDGVGIALIEVPRFQRALARRARLLERVFTPDEIAYGRRKRFGEQNLAARFAAKSAGRAALRAHLDPLPRWADLEVVRRRSGEPTLVWRPDPERFDFRVSLTHDADFAVAALWLNRRPV